MIRTKLLKVFALGLCMSAFITGTAFAQSDMGTSPASGGQIEAEDSALFEKQREIDMYLFADHVDEMETKDFKVVYTGVADSFVEIGITPFSDENADFLYGLFGKDIVKVVASEEAVLYTTEVSPDIAVSSDVNDSDAIVDEVAGVDAADPAKSAEETEIAPEEKVYKDGEELTIQIESADGDLADPELIYQTMVNDESQDDTDVQVISAQTGVADDVKSDVEKGLSAPLTILIIAGGAALIGGAIILSNKKKA